MHNVNTINNLYNINNKYNSFQNQNNYQIRVCYKMKYPYKTVIDYLTPGIFQKLSNNDLISPLNSKKLSNRNIFFDFIWKNQLKLTLKLEEKKIEENFCYYLYKLIKINNFILPITFLHKISFYNMTCEKDTLIINEIFINSQSKNFFTNFILNMVMSNPYLINSNDIKCLFHLCEKYFYIMKKKFILFKSIVLNYSPIKIWTNINDFEKLPIILNLKNHRIFSYGIKGMQNYHCIISAENLGLLMHIRLKNIKIKEDKILAYFRKECNGHKALNHKFKVIITEISENQSLLQIEYLIPINLNGKEINLIGLWLNYILKKIKNYLLINVNNENKI